MERRELLKASVASLIGWSLIPQVLAQSAVKTEIKPGVAAWLRDVHSLGRDLRSQRLSPVAWQSRMAQLYQKITPAEVMSLIDFHKLVAGLEYNSRGATIKRFRFPKMAGVEPRFTAGSKIFAIKQDRAVIPHAHNHMVSSHLILEGSFRVRTWNRRFDLEGEPKHLFLEPSIDRVMHPGELLTMSDEADNIHWLTPTTEIAYTMDIPITDLYAEKSYVKPANPYGLIFVDPTGKADGKGIVRAPILELEQALTTFG